MIPRTLEFQHFLSYRERQALPLTGQGLVLIRGENGAGKSAIADALAVGLFGESLPRGLANGTPIILRGDDLACRHTTEVCEVVVSSDAAQIIRRRRPRVFIVTPARGGDLPGDDREKQAWIDDALGFGGQTFRNAVVFGQGAFERFAQADQADKLRMLDEIQGLDLRGALARAKAWRDSMAAEAGPIVSRIEVLTARLAELATQATGLAAARTRFYEDKAHERERAGAAVDAAKARAIEQTKAVNRLIGLAQRLSELRQAARRAEAEEAVLAANLQQEASIQGQLRALADERRRLDDRVAELIRAGRCPTCRQRTSAIASEFHGDSVTIEANERALRGRLAKVQGEQARRAKTLGTGDARVALARAEAEAGEAAVARARALKIEYDGGYGRAVQALRDLDGRQYPDQDLLNAITQRQEEAEDERKDLATRGERLARAAFVAEYWVEAFGDRGLRSLLIDAVAPFINERIAAHLDDLAAGEASMLLAAQTANKTGGLRERLSVSIDWARGGAGRGAPSGGQNRRTDLALFAALQDVAEARAARPFPFKFFDEPADALDAHGAEQFLAWVRKQASRRGSAFLITHSPLIAESVEADAEWHVILDQEGSHVRF